MAAWDPSYKRQHALQRLTESSVFRQHQAEAITAVLEGMLHQSNMMIAIW